MKTRSFYFHRASCCIKVQPKSHIRPHGSKTCKDRSDNSAMPRLTWLSQHPPHTLKPIHRSENRTRPSSLQIPLPTHGFILAARQTRTAAVTNPEPQPMPGMTVVEVPATKPASPSDGAVPEVVGDWTTTGPISSRPFATTVAWFERFRSQRLCHHPGPSRRPPGWVVWEWAGRLEWMA